MIKLERQIKCYSPNSALFWRMNLSVSQKKLVKKIPSVANGGPTGLDGLAQVGKKNQGATSYHSLETTLAAKFGALGGGNGNHSADSGFPCI